MNFPSTRSTLLRSISSSSRCRSFSACAAAAAEEVAADCSCAFSMMRNLQSSCSFECPSACPSSSIRAMRLSPSAFDCASRDSFTSPLSAPSMDCSELARASEVSEIALCSVNSARSLVTSRSCLVRTEEASASRSASSRMSTSYEAKRFLSSCSCSVSAFTSARSVFSVTALCSSCRCSATLSPTTCDMATVCSSRSLSTMASARLCSSRALCSAICAVIWPCTARSNRCSAACSCAAWRASMSAVWLRRCAIVSSSEPSPEVGRYAAGPGAGRVLSPPPLLRLGAGAPPAAGAPPLSRRYFISSSRK
mmetsp:Transcript_43112/g.106435  ORF Transcript_43112/g.106435 Transcript_43112/m.106435 type:complete len:309 (+) Transcript_43112:768-1694(+)